MNTTDNNKIGVHFLNSIFHKCLSSFEGDSSREKTYGLLDTPELINDSGKYSYLRGLRTIPNKEGIIKELLFSEKENSKTLYPVTIDNAIKTGIISIYQLSNLNSIIGSFYNPVQMFSENTLPKEYNFLKRAKYE